MTNASPKINKHDTLKNRALQQMHMLRRNAERLFAKC